MRKHIKSMYYIQDIFVLQYNSCILKKLLYNEDKLKSYFIHMQQIK